MAIVHTFKSMHRLGCCSGNARSVTRRYEEVAQGPVSLGVKADVITDEA